jgi:hypothetical protein
MGVVGEFLLMLISIIISQRKNTDKRYYGFFNPGEGIYGRGQKKSTKSVISGSILSGGYLLSWALSPKSTKLSA